MCQCDKSYPQIEKRDLIKSFRNIIKAHFNGIKLLIHRNTSYIFIIQILYLFCIRKLNLKSNSGFKVQ